MKKLSFIVALGVLCSVAAAQSPLAPWNTPSSGGNGTIQFKWTNANTIGPFPIPPQATSINVVLNAISVTVNGSFQIETANTVSMSNPVNCGSAISVTTTNINGTGSCTWSATQPWQYVAIIPSSITGNGTGMMSAVSTLAGRGAPTPFPFVPVFQAWDNFAGPSAWPMENHTSSSGHTWVQWSGSGFGTGLTLNGSGEVQNTTVNVATDILSLIPSTPNYTACEWIVPSSSAPGVYIFGRASSAALTGYAVVTSSGTLTLYRYVAGAATSLGSVGQTWTASTAYHVCLSMQSSAISASLNGSTVIGPVTDAVIPGPGQVALFMLNAPNAVTLGLTVQ